MALELGEPLEMGSVLAMALVSVWRSMSQLPWLWRSVSASRPT